MIISTGMATLGEIAEAVNTVRNAGCNDFILLKCTSTYPSLPIDSDISTISNMRDVFDCEVGISDHTMGIGVSVASIAFGAVVIEKHLTINRNDGGVDSAFSLEPHEMKQLVIESQRAWESLGKVKYGPTVSELKSLKFRRSLYVTKSIKNGDEFTESNIRAIRPGLGLPPKYFDLVLGKKAQCNIDIGTPLKWEHLF